MKIIDRFVLRTYIRPFLITFIVMVIFLLLQFVWKYIDDLVGRGVEWYYIVELLFYTSATVVPMALPLAVLISSIMTFGNLGENNEMVAFKSSGISLFRIMRPLFFFMLLITVGAFLFSNYAIPVAEFKSKSLLMNIKDKKPALNIRPGIFYTGIEGYSIKVADKYGPNQSKLRDVYIYDHTEGKGNAKVVVAERGEMRVTPDQMYLVIDLYDGHSYEDMFPAKAKARDNHPFVRSSFEKNTIKFNLSEFQSGDMRKETKEGFTMLSVKQLQSAVDSMEERHAHRIKEFNASMKEKYSFNDLDSLSEGDTIQNLPGNTVLANIKPRERERVIQNAQRLARSHKAYFHNASKEFDWRHIVMRRYTLEWIKKISVSFSVLVLFFVGAPMGAIIRKGGLGMPIVISIIIFLVYHISSYSFEKLGRALIWSPFQAMWTANLILLPLGLFLTYKSGTDSIIFNIELYLKPFRKISGIFARIFNKGHS